MRLNKNFDRESLVGMNIMSLQMFCFILYFSLIQINAFFKMIALGSMVL